MGPLVLSETWKEGGPIATFLIPALPITTPSWEKAEGTGHPQSQRDSEKGGRRCQPATCFPFSLYQPLFSAHSHTQRPGQLGGQAGVHTMSDKG